MRTIGDLDELRTLVGTELGRSDWFAVEQERIDAFAEATGDDQWIHVDVERAAAGPYGTTIAHGYLTLSLIPVLVRDLYTVEGVSTRINYGLDRVRFPAPLPSGSRVRGTLELVDVTDVTGGVQVRSRATVEREGGDRPVCVADTLARFLV